MRIRVRHPGDEEESVYDVDYVKFQGQLKIKTGYYGELRIADPNIEIIDDD